MPLATLTNGQSFSFEMQAPSSIGSMCIGDDKGVAFFAEKASETIVKLADPSGMVELTDSPSAGKIGLSKSADSMSINVSSSIAGSIDIDVCISGSFIIDMTSPA